ncbi:hypothetical protein Tco_0356995 [Tanacetum coccineum]
MEVSTEQENVSNDSMHVNDRKKTHQRFVFFSSKENNDLNKERRKEDSARSVLRRSCKRLHQNRMVEKNFVGDIEGKEGNSLSYTRRRETKSRKSAKVSFVFAINATQERRRNTHRLGTKRVGRRLCETG